MMQRREFVKAIGASVAGLASGFPQSLRAERTPESAASQLAAFIDTFTSPSRTETPSDLSAASFAKELAGTRAALTTLRAIDPAALNVDDRIDRKFAESIVGRELQQAKMQPWRKDPRVYMRFRSIPTTIGRPGDLSTKSDTVLALLSIVPAQLEHSPENLEGYVPRFQELSVFMAKGARDIFDRDVPRFAESSPKKASLLEAAREARRALDGYIDFLERELPRRPTGDWPIGRATYDEMLHGQYLLTAYDSDSLYKYGWDQFNATVQKLEEVARTIDRTKTWRQLTDEIKRDYPSPSRMIEAHQKWVDKARAHIVAKHLIPRRQIHAGGLS